MGAETGEGFFGIVQGEEPGMVTFFSMLICFVINTPAKFLLPAGPLFFEGFPGLVFGLTVIGRPDMGNHGGFTCAKLDEILLCQP